MSNGASDDTIAAYAAQLLDLEADIEVTQGAKKDVYTNARETYGKRFADSLKLAIKRHRMDADKRDAADEVDAEAERMLSIISRPSAPRATHAREIIEEFDPETGEIQEPVAAGHSPEANTPAQMAGTDRPVAIVAAESDAIEISASIPQPAEGVTPTSAGHGDESAVLPSVALVVADRTKPNPICQDPEDCGIEASWNHVCGSCLRRRAHVEAAGAVQ